MSENTNNTNIEVAERIKDCTIYNKADLSLKELKLDEIPDLHDLWWVEKLDLSCNNIRTVNRENLPKNLKVLFLNQNKLKDIKHSDIPDFVEALNLMSNEICHFDGSQFKNLIKLNISVNCLETFYFPPGLMKADVSINVLKEIDEFPETLLKISCEDNLLDEIKYINNNLQYINISDNKFTELPNFPESMETIIAKNNVIEDLWYIAENVIELNLENNRIKNFYNYTVEFPKSLKILNLNDNMLSEIEIELPEGIEEIYLKSNRLENLPNIPESVKILDVSDNCLNEMPQKIKDMHIQLNYSNNLLADSNDSSRDSAYELNFLFGNQNQHTYGNQDHSDMYESHNTSSKTILDYFPEQKSPSITVNTYNSSYNPHYSFVSHSPPKKKYIHIEHKRRVVV
jgi:Leucine-rich repeat (LRR) protein